MGRPSLGHPQGRGQRLGSDGPGPPPWGCPSLGPWTWNDRPAHAPSISSSLVFPQDSSPHLHPFKSKCPGWPTPQLSVGVTAGISWQSAGGGRREKRKGGIRETSPTSLPHSTLSEGWAVSWDPAPGVEQEWLRPQLIKDSVRVRTEAPGQPLWLRLAKTLLARVGSEEPRDTARLAQPGKGLQIHPGPRAGPGAWGPRPGCPPRPLLPSGPCTPQLLRAGGAHVLRHLGRQQGLQRGDHLAGHAARAPPLRGHGGAQQGELRPTPTPR